MSLVALSSPEELADQLRDLNNKSRTIAIVGNSSKNLMGGPVGSPNMTLSTSRLKRVLQYERDDLTISLEAGLPFAEAQALLARNGQMIALDPPFSSQATIGGILASNSSGPLRRTYGTARDLVIGMTFATMEGKLVKTGGMVVKNVAGLDMGKLMIGSFGTLGVITSANFRVHSLPPETITFLFACPDLGTAIERRNQILRSYLQPLALDLISPAAATRMGWRNTLLAVKAGGSSAVLQRYQRELSGAETLSGDAEQTFWSKVRNFIPDFLKRQPGGVVLRVSSTLQDLPAVLGLVSDPCISRAASGVSYIHLSSWQGVLPIWKAGRERSWGVVVEFAPESIRGTKELWLQSESGAAANAFGMMKRVKEMFDPKHLLNQGRLYGRV
jgi:glycolate oxidase FAD binding subunit